MKEVRRDWALFAGLTFCFAFGFAVYGGIFQNYIREVFHADPEQLGMLESLREVPGLLVVFVAGSLAALAEPRLAGVALIGCAAGVALSGDMPGYWGLVAITAFWSVGAHLWFTVQPSITIALSGGQQSGKRLGQMGAVGAAAVLTGLLFTRVAKMYIGYTPLFRLAGALVFVGAILAFFLSHRACGGPRQSLVFRREYGRFYLLTFLEGCRRQIFGTFASFVLIYAFNVPVSTILTLALVNAVVGMIAGPVIGRLIDRHGERPMLTIYYSALIFVFGGYALSHTLTALFSLYLLDNLLFGFSVGITTFLHKIVREGEFTPSLAMGTTMNHIAAVVVPITGGLLWKTLDNYRIPFYIGLGVVLLSLVATRQMPTGRCATAPEPELAVETAD